MQHRPLVLPGPRAIFRHSWPKILEGKVIPLVLFLGFLDLLGTTGALLSALGWSLAVVAYRMRNKSKVPGLVILSTIGLAAKTALALATGSLVVYFLQPTISTALVGFAFLISVPLKRPLAERLAHDICPFEDATRSHPALRAFLSNVSVLWAVASMVNFSITLWLLLTQSVTTFVLVKSVLGPAITVTFAAVAILWFRSRMARSGVSVIWRSTVPA